MKINKHIQAIAEKHSYSTYHSEILQFIWENRNKRNFFCLNVASVSSSGMSRQFKAVIHYKGAFVNVTRIVAQVTDNTYNKKSDTISIGGCGMDMGFALLESLYMALTPKTVKMNAYKLSAVQDYFYL